MPVSTIFFLSPTGTSCGKTRNSFSTGKDSPVRGASSHCNEWISLNRPSVGILSPASSMRISPGTSSFARTSCSFPPLRTVMVGVSIFFKASSARSARYSWMNPNTAQNMTITTIMPASTSSPTTADRTVAIRRMIIRVFLNWLMKRVKGEVFLFCCQFVVAVYSKALFGLFCG